MWKVTVMMVLPVILTASLAAGAAPLRILYITKSEGFEHSPVSEPDGRTSHSEMWLARIAEEIGATLRSTKNAVEVNAENLKNYDVVIFYTQGDLTKIGEKDAGEPMAATGVEELLAWVKAGGGFVAIHSGTDSFRSGKDGEPTPYTEMVGGEFRTHGPQFKGTLKVVDPAHPIMAGQPAEWEVMEEWYLHRNFNAKTMRVLATLDPGRAGRRVKGYDLPDIPMVWCSTYGEGRVFVNAMGHREDVWDHEHFRSTLVNGIKWAAGAGGALADPNFGEVISDELDPATGARRTEASSTE
ncbi:MAG TPA: ThuA domain-containing protein [Candidatus Hydrogenedentes bacterium]|nr:ThuA domain-containing protein [Candidatus Hydrogenedentota bacterium]